MTVKISTRYNRLKAKQDKIYADIRALQEECTHPNATSEYKSNTGNWCPGDDHYWIEFRCPDCQKFWTKDQ